MSVSSEEITQRVALLDLSIDLLEAMTALQAQDIIDFDYKFTYDEDRMNFYLGCFCEEFQASFDEAIEPPDGPEMAHTLGFLNELAFTYGRATQRFADIRLLRISDANQ